jgi:hypothetical protein
MKILSVILLSASALCGCAPDEAANARLAALEKKVAALEAASEAQKVALQKAPVSVPPGTQNSHSFPEFDGEHSITLRAGQSVILARGQTAKVPAGTAVLQPGPGGSGANINGQKNTVNAGPGVIVTVATDASGPADNLVIVK